MVARIKLHGVFCLRVTINLLEFRTKIHFILIFNKGIKVVVQFDITVEVGNIKYIKRNCARDAHSKNILILIALFGSHWHSLPTNKNLNNLAVPFCGK